MVKQVTSFLGFASSIAIGCLVTLTPATAQIVPDNTLPVNSQVTPGCTVCTIDGGTVRGVNLFHSFSSFGVPTGGEAFFNNGLQIQNIFSRVTGNSVSNIDGLIRANGGANLFLLNPNGIIFGRYGRLNIGGSFLASTASSFKFSDGVEFSATNPQTPPLLTLSVPIGLQYGRNLGKITLQRSNLQVPNSQTLALVGGVISFEGLVSLLQAGRIELGAVAETGTVGLNGNGTNVTLSFPQGVALADISLTNGIVVGVTAGELRINTGTLLLQNGAQIIADTYSTRDVGNLTINASQSVQLLGTSANGLPSRLRASALASSGNAGNLTINTGTLLLRDGAQISTGTFSAGNGGNLIVNASQSVQVIGTTTFGFVYFSRRKRRRKRRKLDD